MDVSLNAEIRRFVEAKVKAGQFASFDEAINGLLTTVRQQETLSAADIDALRRELDMGLSEADRAEFVEFSADDVIAERRAAMRTRRKVS
jgi:antitoxin ParD1/3/4